MTEATPGPWYVDTTYVDGRESFQVIKSESAPPKWIASTWGGARTPNANLMASAPALLSRLEANTKLMIAERDCFYEGASIDDECGFCVYEEDQQILDAMDKEIALNQRAIDKARGVK